MDFGQSISTCYKKYFDFKGRARLSEYWWFALFSFLIAIPTFIISLAMVITQSYIAVLVPWAFYLLIVGIPGVAVTVRRLHDMGQSGIWAFVSYGLQIMTYVLPEPENSDFIDNIPAIIGNLFGGILSIAVFVMTLIPSQQKDNKYGPASTNQAAIYDGSTPPPPPTGYTPIS